MIVSSYIQEGFNELTIDLSHRFYRQVIGSFQTGIQKILDAPFALVPKSCPVGCNLVLMRPKQPTLHLKAGNVTLDAPQHWGSVSKQFTAAAIVKLVEQGYINYSDDIRKYLPDLPKFTFDKKTYTVTVDHLLQMRSGLPEVLTLVALSGQTDQDVQMEEKLALLSRHPGLQFEPGSDGRYCNTNYYLLAKIAEHAAKEHKLIGPKETFSDLLSRYIFKPLEMSSRCSFDPECPKSIEGYDEKYELCTTRNRTWGATGIIGPASDMEKWDASIGKGEWKALQEPPSMVPLAPPRDSIYCRGLNRADVGDYRVTYHGGAIEGFVTAYRRYDHVNDPSKSFSFFLTSNFNDIGMVEGMTEQLAEEISGEDLRLLSPLRPEIKRAAISDKDIDSFKGTYVCRPLGSTWQMQAVEKERGVWELQMHFVGEKRCDPITFIPVLREGGRVVFEGPIGDRIELTPNGFVLIGANAAPFDFDRIQKEDIPSAKQAELETSRPPLPQVFNADTIGEIIEDITGSLFTHYPAFPVVAKWIEHLRENLEVYKKCKDPDEFKEKVNKNLYAIFQDKHLRLRFQTVSEAKEADNYTMTSGILPNTDHVGLIHLRGFGPVKIGADQATVEEEGGEARTKEYHDTIQKLKDGNVKSVIIDLRQNNGGYPEAAQLLCSYFMKPDVPLSSIQNTIGGLKEFKTLTEAELPVKNRLLETIPVYILTSKDTFSAAERFTNDMQIAQRATVIGDERTKGGANPGTFPNCGEI